jgi:hypothetical protein
MTRTFLRHGRYGRSDPGIKVLDLEGIEQARAAERALGSLARDPNTKVVVSDCDRTIETGLILVLPFEDAWARIQMMRTLADRGRPNERRYVFLHEPTAFPFELCGDCVHSMPAKWRGYGGGNLIFIGHEPVAEKLGLALREGCFGIF